VFAAHSKYRQEITLHREVQKGFQFRDVGEDCNAKPWRSYIWSKMLPKVFKVDVTKCDACDARVRKISAMTDPMKVRRYLKHENIDYEPPARAPPRYQQGEFDFDGSQYDPAGDPLST